MKGEGVETGNLIMRCPVKPGMTEEGDPSTSLGMTVKRPGTTRERNGDDSKETGNVSEETGDDGGRNQE